MDPLEKGVKESLREGARGASGAARGLFSFSTFKFFLSILVFGILATVLFSFGAFGDTTIGVSLGGFGQNKDLANGLVGHWTFDGPDMITNVADSSGWGNHGMLSNPNTLLSTSTSIAGGVLGQALYLINQNDNFVNAQSAAVLDDMTSMSISVWIRNDESSVEERMIVNKGSGIGAGGFTLALSNTGSGRVTLYISCDAGNFNRTTNSNAVALGEWVHITALWNGTVGDIYINGVKVSSYAVSTDCSGGADTNAFLPLTIGANDNGGGTFKGGIDDVRVYNRVLSEEEIMRLYGLGATTHVSVSLGGQGENKDLSSGLIAHYTFDGITAGSNSAGSSLHGVVGGQTSTTTTRGKLGQAIVFDATDDRMVVADNAALDIPTTHTLAAWIKPHTVTGDRLILFRGHCGVEYATYALKISGLDGTGFDGSVADKINYTIRSVGGGSGLTASQTSSLVPDEWVHVVGTHDGTTMSLYINGVLEDTSAGNSAAPYAGTTPLQFGSDDNCGGARRYQFDGAIDDVRIYNRTLSAEEVSKLYGLGNTTKVGTTLGGVGENKNLSSGLVGHWTFDGPNLLQNATDSSGVGNTGYLSSGFTSTTTIRGKLGQALFFDGSDDYTEISHSSSLTFGTNPFTISLWFRPRTTFTSSSGVTQPLLTRYTGANSNNGLFLQGTDFSNSGLSAGRFVLKLEGNANSKYVGTSQTTWNAGEWYHVVAVVNGTAANSSTYVNGQLDRVTGTDNGGAFDDTLITAPWRFGKGDYDSVNVASNNFFSGDIDDIRIYNRTLSAEEVQRLYQLGQ